MTTETKPATDEEIAQFLAAMEGDEPQPEDAIIRALIARITAERERADKAEADHNAGRELMRQAWHEFNAIRARDGAPEGVSHAWWNEITEALGELLADDAKPWMLGAARALIEPERIAREKAEAESATLAAQLAAAQQQIAALREAREKAEDRVEELEREAGKVAAEFEGDATKTLGNLAAEFDETFHEWSEIEDGWTVDNAAQAIFDGRADLLRQVTASRERAEKAEADCDAWCKSYDEQGKVLNAIRTERDALAAQLTAAQQQIAALREALTTFRNYGCPVCHGDCASANPPVHVCPMQEVRATLSQTEGG